MAARINTRFLLILIIIVGLVGAVAGGIWLFSKRDAEYFYGKAEELRSSNALRLAYRQYERALELKPRYPEALDGIEALFEDLVPNSQAEAAEYAQKALAVRSHRMIYFGDQPEPYLAYLDLLEATSRFYRPDYWSAGEEATERFVDAADEYDPTGSDPLWSLARPYRAMWLAAPVANGVNLAAARSEEQRAEGRGLAAASVAANPGRDFDHAVLIATLADEANRQRLDGTERAADEARAALDAAVDAALADVPEGVRSMTAVVGLRLERLLEAQRDLVTAVRTDSGVSDAMDAIDAIRIRTIADSERLQAALTRVVGTTEGTPGWESATARGLRTLARVALTDARFSPIDLATTARATAVSAGVTTAPMLEATLVSGLADARRFRDGGADGEDLDSEDELRRRIARLDRAEAIAAEIVALPDPPVGLDAALLRSIRVTAESLLFEIAFLRWDTANAAPEAGDPGASELSIALSARTPELVDAIKERIDRFEQAVADLGGDPEDRGLTWFGRGLAEFAAGRPRRAAPSLDRVVSMDDASLDPWRLQIARYTLVQALQADGAHARALEVAGEAMMAGDTRAPMVHARGVSQIATGDLAGAERTLDLLGRADGAERWRADLQRKLAIETGTGFESDIDQRIAAINREAREGDEEVAYRAARELAAENPENPSVTMLVVRLALATERRDEAIAELQAMQEAMPDNEAIAAQLVRLTSDDPVRRVSATVNAQFADPIDRAVAMVVALDSVAAGLRRQLEADPEADDAASLQSDLDRVEGAIAEREIDVRSRLATAEADGVRVSYLALEGWNNRELEQAVRAEDWTRAAEVVAAIERDDLDRAGGALARGLVLLARATSGANPDRDRLLREAETELDDATGKLPFSARAWNILSEIRNASGDLEGSMDALGRAYDNDPVDRELANRYINGLLRLGNDVQAREVAREASRRSPDDRRLRNAWLDLEARAGNAILVLEQRRRIYVDDPGDVTNAQQYALALAQTTPTRATILGDDGAPRFAPGRWDRFSAAEKSSQVQNERRAWLERARTIAESLRPDPDSGLPAVGWRLLTAQLDRAEGDVPGALATLRAGIELQEDPKARRAAIAAAVEAMYRMGEARPAIELVRSAATGSAAAAIDSAWLESRLAIELRQWAAAIAPLRRLRVAATDGALEVPLPQVEQLRVDFRSLSLAEVEQDLVRALVSVGQIAEARTIFDTGAIDRSTRGMRRLGVQLLVGEHTAARLAGDTERADAIDAAIDAELTALITEEPSDAGPWAIRIARIVRAAELTGRDSLLDEAERVLADAEAAAAGAPELRSVRLQLLESRGEIDRVVSALAAQLEDAPTDDQLRNRVVDAYLVADRPNDAERVILDAIDRYGFQREALDWQNRLGALYERENRYEDAARVYRDAWQGTQGEEVVLLLGMVRSLTRMEPPQYRTVRDVLLDPARAGDLEARPVLRTILARSLAGLGDQAGAMREFERAYRDIERLIAARQMPVSAVAAWVGSVRVAAGGDRMSEVEALARRIMGEPLEVWEVSALAQNWFVVGPAGHTRAIDLQKEAVAMMTGTEPGAVAGRSALLQQLGGYQLEAGQTDAAYATFERALAETPEDPALLNNVAFLQATQRDDASGAYARAMGAIARAPRNWAYLDTAGKICALLERWDEAESYLRRSIRISEQAQNLFHLAEVFAATGRADEAMDRLDRASELLGPDEDDLRADINALADRIAGSGG